MDVTVQIKLLLHCYGSSRHETTIQSGFRDDSLFALDFEVARRGNGNLELLNVVCSPEWLQLDCLSNSRPLGALVGSGGAGVRRNSAVPDWSVALEIQDHIRI